MEKTHTKKAVMHSIFPPNSVDARFLCTRFLKTGTFVMRSVLCKVNENLEREKHPLPPTKSIENNAKNPETSVNILK